MRAREQERRERAGGGRFDKVRYVAKYPDVASSGMDPAQHWAHYGAESQENIL